MPDELIDAAARPSGHEELNSIDGVAIAVVSDNVDLSGLGRVQVELPWNPRIKPWARIATPLAGGSYGTYFVPAVGSEVLLAFNHGDLRDAYVIGGLWNAVDRPPFGTPDAPDNTRAIVTPSQQKIEFTELEDSVTVTNAAGHRVAIGADTVEVTTEDGAASITLSATGDVTLRAEDTLSVSAGSISLQAQTVDISADLGVSIDGGVSCSVQADLIELN